MLASLVLTGGDRVLAVGRSASAGSGDDLARSLRSCGLLLAAVTVSLDFRGLCGAQLRGWHQLVDGASGRHLLKCA